MHFEILVEDISGKAALDILVPKMIGDQDTFKVIPYKGVGRIPRNLQSAIDSSKRQLLENLPKLLRGYSKSYTNFPAVVFVICDLDKKCLKSFREEILNAIMNCDPCPETCLCIAIEEGEAWLLGDIPAIKKAYPKVKNSVLNSYSNDEICGTWERLADAIYIGGSQKLSGLGWQTIGAEKSAWAINIAPHMDVDNNCSPSFNYLLGKMQKYASSGCDSL